MTRRWSGTMQSVMVSTLFDTPGEYTFQTIFLNFYMCIMHKNLEVQFCMGIYSTCSSRRLEILPNKASGLKVIQQSQLLAKS